MICPMYAEVSKLEVGCNKQKKKKKIIFKTKYSTAFINLSITYVWEDPVSFFNLWKEGTEK